MLNAETEQQHWAVSCPVEERGGSDLEDLQVIPEQKPVNGPKQTYNLESPRVRAAEEGLSEAERAPED